MKEIARKTKAYVVNNIGMNVREKECRDIDWIRLAQDRDRQRALLNKVMNLRVPYY
jgi:hypothetical protein